MISRAEAENSRMVMPAEYDNHRPRAISQLTTNTRVPTPESVRTRVRRPRRHVFDNWARAGWVAVMWSAAVSLPTFPGLA